MAMYLPVKVREMLRVDERGRRGVHLPGAVRVLARVSVGRVVRGGGGATMSCGFYGLI